MRVQGATHALHPLLFRWRFHFVQQGYSRKATDMDDYIKLDQFLKLAGVVRSGGEAKHLIQGGGVKVNGEVEIRRGRKLRAGDVVLVDEEELVVEIAREE